MIFLEHKYMFLDMHLAFESMPPPPPPRTIPLSLNEEVVTVND